jgi:hypothetical protein
MSASDEKEMLIKETAFADTKKPTMGNYTMNNLVCK